MTPSNEDHEANDVVDFHDRLMDSALAEVVGGHTPPDLKDRILAASASAQPTAVEYLARRQFLRWSWIGLAVAASLLVCGSVLLLPSWQNLRQTAQQSSVNATGVNEQIAGQRRDRVVEFAVKPAPTAGRAVALQTESPAVAAPAFQAVEGRQIGLEGLIESDGPPAAPAEESKVEDLMQSTIQNQTWGGKGQRFRLSTSPGAGEPQFQKVPQILMGDNRLALGEPVRPYYLEDDVRELPQLREGLERSEAGTGRGLSGDQYTRIYENPFVKAVGGDAVSTFSIDVDTASYANVRQFLMDMNQLPPPDAVRIEELVNYFDYDYAGPNSSDEAPFAAHVEVAGCPWQPQHRLVRIGVKGREIERGKRPPSNLVFLVDVSGSMDEPNKLPLVVDGLRQLTRELGENDRVAIVVYASSEGLALASTRGDQQATILAALDQLRAGGSTAGGAGIQLAYQIAEDHFIRGGTNRVILCTDGDFNVGVTSTAELERLVVNKAKQTGVFLSVLGFGRGNLNDAMMQTIADRGNGNHHYVDNLREARKVLVEEMTGTLITIAKDVKIQVEFNPAQVAGYRLLGYENRMLRTEDFNDDTKDAGEIGAGHTVTALYEVIPAGKSVDVPSVDELKYQPSANQPADESTPNTSRELLTLKMRYKPPAGDTSQKLEWAVTDSGQTFNDATDDFRFAAAVASFGLLLRGSEYQGSATYDGVAEIAHNSLGRDEHGYRAEFLDMVRKAHEMQSTR
jgi:Ca-activated chloride channel family protein